jgi:predicted metal-dependent phosphoesterase TrpH
MNPSEDLHVHTLVSDGDATPRQLLEAAARAGLKTLSFCDHDAIGAYRHFGDVFAEAAGLGIELVAGIELDSVYMGREVHLLGYGFDLGDGPLNAHLEMTQRLRRERVGLQIGLVNAHFGRQVVDLDKVRQPSPGAVRETLMKPHLVFALLAEGLFAEYREAARWLSQNARVDVEVPKLPFAEAVALLRRAGGEAVLAHPGYLARETTIPLAVFLEEFVHRGLTGIEVEYRYLQTSPDFPDPGSERKMVREVAALAERFKLKMTRGSDAHDVETMVGFAKKVVSSQ